jgi:hypothetical protein
MSEPALGPERRARYLLGLASEEEREAIEAEFFGDDESFERLQAAEDELFDTFAAGGLPPAEEAAFRQRYLSSAEGRQRLTFARALRQRADEAVAQIEGARPRRTRSVASWAALAAALVAALTAGWLGVQNMRLRGEVERLRAERQADPTPSPPQPVDAKPVTPQAQRTAVVRLPAQPRTGPTDVTLEPGTRSVRLEVALKGDEDSATFDAVVRSADGKEVWRQEGLAPKEFGAPLVVTAPADLLADGEYVLSVEGEAARDAPQGSTRRYRLRLKR